jgi:hypothetical protein
MRRSRLPAATAVALAAVLAACESIPPRSSADLDPRDLDWAYERGNNTIVGVAQMKAGDGVSRTCAALPVRLAPDTSYTRERVQLLYGDADHAFVTAAEAKRARAQPGADVSPNYERSLKAVKCDARGRFTFKDLPDGTYYVMAPVVWRGKLGEVSEGGFFMQRVTVEGGETARLAMNPR